MRVILMAAVAALALSACGKKGNDQANADTNVTTTETTTNTTMDANAMDQNGAMGAATASNGDAGTNATGGMDANMATNSATENALEQKDLKTHDHDKNLKNGI